MKRLLTVLFLLLPIVCCSCKSTFDVKERFALPLSFTASTKGSDTQYSVSITNEYCDIGFNAPSLLEGATLHFEDEKSFLSVGEFSFAIDENCFPAMKTLFDTVRLLSSSDAIGIEQENGVKYTIDETVVLVYYDKDTETVTGLRTEELGRVFEFNLFGLEYEAQSNGAGRS